MNLFHSFQKASNYAVQMHPHYLCHCCITKFNTA